MQEMKDIQEEKRVMLDSVASVWGIKQSNFPESAKSYGEKKLIERFLLYFF